MLNHFGQIELFQSADLGGDHAQHQSYVATLLKNVDTEASQAGHAVRHVELGGFFEFLFLPVGHHAESHVQHVFGRNAGLVGQRDKFSIHAHVGIVANFQVKIRSFALHGDSQKIINMHSSLLTRNQPGRAETYHAATRNAIREPAEDTCSVTPYFGTNQGPGGKPFTHNSVRRAVSSYNVTD